MTIPQKLVDGHLVPLTSDEIAARAAEEAAYVPPVPTFKLRASDFLLRFTEDERAAMRAIAQTVPQFADYLMQLQTVQYVDVLDQIVPLAMDALIGAGIIDGARKTEILSPVLGPTESLIS